MCEDPGWKGRPPGGSDGGSPELPGHTCRAVQGMGVQCFLQLSDENKIEKKRDERVGKPRKSIHWRRPEILKPTRLVGLGPGVYRGLSCRDLLSGIP